MKNMINTTKSMQNQCKINAKLHLSNGSVVCGLSFVVVDGPVRPCRDEQRDAALLLGLARICHARNGLLDESLLGDLLGDLLGPLRKRDGEAGRWLFCTHSAVLSSQSLAFKASIPSRLA